MQVIYKYSTPLQTFKRRKHVLIKSTLGLITVMTKQFHVILQKSSSKRYVRPLPFIAALLLD